MIPKLLYLAPLALAYWVGVAGASHRSAAGARILMYHGVPRRDAGQIERQLRYLRRNFEIVSLGSLVSSLRSSACDLRRRIVLTFDDGLRNNVWVVYPILKRLGIPATFFVCPRLADTGRWLWNHEARQRLHRLDAHQRRRLASELGHGSFAIESLIGWMKSLDLAARREVEARVRAATPGFRPTSEERDAFDIASWDDLRTLDPEVVTVGSHTLTHAILPSLQGAELESEIADSRRELEAGLQRPVDEFAYPNGDYNAAVHACVRKHYGIAVTASPGRIDPTCDAHLLPRESAPPGALRLALSTHRIPEPFRPALATS